MTTVTTQTTVIIKRKKCINKQENPKIEWGRKKCRKDNLYS